MDNDQYKTALGRAMTLCSAKECCQSDIRSKLETWGVSPNDAQKILNLLVKENFINEARYASAFARDRFRYNKWGKVKITAHLKARRIAGEIIREALDSIDKDTYYALLEKLLEEHRKKIKAKNQYDLKAKLMRYALSKGFEQGLVYEILSIE